MKKYKETEYSKKLRDPRWQKMRLSIMQRDRFSCQKCFSTTRTLNVHHCYYERGNDPWDYPESSLVTLCENCHEVESHRTETVKLDLLKAIFKKGLLCSDIDEITSGFENWAANHNEADSIILAVVMSSPILWQQIREIYFEYLKNNQEVDDAIPQH